MPSITVSLSADRDYIRWHKIVGNELASRRDEELRLEGKLSEKTGLRVESGEKVAGGLTAQNPAAGAALGGIPYDIEIEDDGGENMTIHTDEEAVAYRAGL